MAEQRRILVVEGEENLNWNIVNSLQKDGYIVRGVTGGAEAIRLLWSEEYDIVICAQQMPDADGSELLQWMRTYCPGAHMVMLGTPGKEIGRAQALEMGVASYLEKPLDIHALKEELRRLLHQTGFSASLDSFDLLDVVQIITMSRKSIALVVSTGLEEQGILRFQNGELIWAEYGTLRGEEAFFALAAHKNGTVVHRPWNDQITPNVMLPLSRLIFQALQYRSKYAEYQQLSSEIEAVRPAAAMPPATVLPAALQGGDEEDDDRPFQFTPDDLPAERPSSKQTFEQMMPSVPASGPVQQAGSAPGGMQKIEPEQSREWWEASGSIARVNRAGEIKATTDEKIDPVQDPLLSPSAVYKTPAAQQNNLPAWLTEQPTYLDLPVLRGNTGQMPAAQISQQSVSPGGQPPLPAAQAPVSSNSQPLPTLPRTGGPDWSAQIPFMGFDPSESGLRKIKPDEALHTGKQPSVGLPSPSGPLRQSPAEWQTPNPASLNEVSSPLRSGDPVARTTSDRVLDPFQIQSIQRAGNGSVAEPRQPISPIYTPTGGSTTSRSQPDRPISGPYPGASQPATPSRPAQGSGVNQTRRNYPALAAALQTLGYSVTGFVASAVVSMDGTPVAQVAVDDLDISPMCAHFSAVVQGALQALEQGYWDHFEHTVITSRTQHILLRIIGQRKDVFQVLITTRETDPQNSLEVMGNVEAAILAAL